MPSPSPQTRRPNAGAFWQPRGTTTTSLFNARSTRSYLTRLPLFTRAVVALIIGAYLLTLQSLWDIRAWGGLEPAKMNFASLYRTNTFPFIHLGIFHMVGNLLALTPLLDRFECEHGTLTSVALFFGPFATLPALIYIVTEKLLYLNTTIMGASVWVFLLLGIEAMKTYRTNPSFVVASVPIPTWTTPLMIVFVVAALVPHTSLLGHLCGLAIGYLCGMGYLRFLAPPEKALRWIEGRLNLLARLPRYVSVDQKTYGRFGVLPSVTPIPSGSVPAIGLVGSTQRLGP